MVKNWAMIEREYKVMFDFVTDSRTVELLQKYRLKGFR